MAKQTITKQQIVLKGHGHVEEALMAAPEGYDPLEVGFPGMGVSLVEGVLELGNGSSDGDVGPVMILMEDNLLGKTVADAYKEGSRARYYIPQIGDEVLLHVKEGESFDQGALLMLEAETGYWLESSGTPAMTPFIAMESTGGALGEDSLIVAKRI
jgi:hypothetical protein